MTSPSPGRAPAIVLSVLLGCGTTQEPRGAATHTPSPIKSPDDGATTAKSTGTMSLYAFTLPRLDGTPEKLDTYRGKVVLVVNTASECGYTPQYDGLEKLYSDLKDKGFA